jgi:hypothetical protein
VFDGLLPEPHNEAILRLLFICGHWHGLAKLRIHTDLTLKIFDDETARIGAEFRAFNDKICPAFETHELHRETEARRRRRSKKAKRTDAPLAPFAAAHSEADGPLPKKFNLQTYKYHSLGDHPDTVRIFGTSDSYSTEPVCSLTLFAIW